MWLDILIFIIVIILMGLAYLVGWFFGVRSPGNGKSPKSRDQLSHEYFVGLNYLLNEQQDKAVDVFIKMLDVDSDTVETHLALGSLFRRRGEVDRAIRIHQNLIARPQLNKEQRIHSLLQLGQDYMSAGVLDRAERLFLEVVDSGAESGASLQYLLDIYEQEKDWQQAITIAKRLESSENAVMRKEIAHYYCELAELANQSESLDKIYGYLKKAIAMDRHCFRASLIQARLEMETGNYKTAIKLYTKTISQDPNFIADSLHELQECYLKLNDIEGFYKFLQACMQNNPRISVVLAVAEYLRRKQNDDAAIEFITQHLQQYPSLRGLQYLIELQLSNAGIEAKEDLTVLQNIMENFLRNRPIYRCEHCGYSGKKMHWQCPGCKRWTALQPIHGMEGD